MVTLEWSIVILFLLLVVLSIFSYAKVLRKIDKVEEKSTILSSSYKYAYFTIVLILLLVIVYQLIFNQQDISYLFICIMTGFMVILVHIWTVIVKGNKINSGCKEQNI
ncbi:hypothetical protein [Alkalihalobacillus pseudalcaliphilus]|uniref:hypothetical protein n=1 Tax=Alkalihalobacillus pseudalcaliphilus TaxID=79884 RepID=UPI00064E009D|nr:hypothetical protein [Alkalihalobacillus pseudalcaliphilus]KMK74587.1 hypothetical protein AB990_18965 [Alkalihalobacillus pseudalcaliphilus]